MDDGAGEQYRAAAVIGGGVIGGSWTALFLARGLRVTVSDPRPDIEPVVRTGLRAVAPALGELGLDVAALVEDTGALIFESDVAAAVADADVVQENVPERLDLKQRVWAAVEAAAPTEALLASASSNFPAPRSLSGCAGPSVWSSAIPSTRPTSSRSSRSCQAPARIPPSPNEPSPSTGRWGSDRSS
jgi:ketoreductase RED1